MHNRVCYLHFVHLRPDSTPKTFDEKPAYKKLMKKTVTYSNEAKNTLNGSLSRSNPQDEPTNKSTEHTLLNDNDDLRKIQYVATDNVTFNFLKLTNSTCHTADIWLNEPTIHMVFVMEGKRGYQPQPGHGPASTLIAGQHCLGYYPAIQGKVLYASETPCFTVDISLSEAYFRAIFQNDLTQLGSFGALIQKKQSALLGNQIFQLTSAQKEVLLAMHDCSLTGQLQKLFLEGKLRELLTLQIAQSQSSCPADSATLRHDDVDTFHSIRDQLAQNLTHPPSLKELTLLAGMNRTKLMSGFKDLFGTTIYSYVADLRMERAKELLIREPLLKIADVARRVGFKNPNNFSAAFKKKFGYSPNSLR